MWTLVKREIRDQWMHLVVPTLFMFFGLMSIISREFFHLKQNIPILGMRDDLLAIYWIPIALFPLLAAKLGVSQIHMDRTLKISAYLLSQPTSRPRLMTAKIATGLLWIAYATVPFILTSAIILTMRPQLIPGGTDLLLKMIVTAILANIAGYSLGLMRGWGTNKYIPHFLAIGLCIPLLALIVIKGFGPETWVLLLIIIFAALTNATQKFLTTPL